MSSGQSPFDFSQYNGSQTRDSVATPTGGPDGGLPGSVDWIGGSSVFGTASSSPDSSGLPRGVVSAPVPWLFSAFGAAFLSLVLASVFGAAPVAAISAWVLGGPIATALVAVFTLKDTKSRTFPLYSGSRVVPWLYRITIAASLAAVLVSAWSIANWAGRL